MRPFSKLRKLMNDRPLTARKSEFDTRMNLLVEPLEDRLLLTTYLVDSLSDSASAIPDGSLTLREAVLAANTNVVFGDAAAGSANGDTIKFAANLTNGDINLASGEIAVMDDLVIDGTNRNITINAGNTSRVFNVDAGERVIFRNMTLENGSAIAGGAILTANGLTTLNRMRLIDNASSGQGGGAIFNSGTLVVVNSQFARNEAGGLAGNGGAIFNDGGGVRVTTSNFINNDAAISGGGLYSADGNVRLAENEFRGNSAVKSGGGLAITNGTLRTIKVDLFSNTASDGLGAVGDGGAIAIAGSSTRVVIASSALRNNTAAGSGGAIHNDTGKLTVQDSVISNNTASGALVNNGGGGIYTSSGVVDVISSVMRKNVAGGTTGSGGAILVAGGDAFTALQDTFIISNNAASEGGGIWNQAGSNLVILDSVLQDNFARGDAADNGGGAVFNNGGNVNVNNSTIISNTATGTNGSGGGILSTDGNVVVTNSTITANSASRAGGGVEVIDGYVRLKEVTLGGAAAGAGNLAGPSGLASPGNGGGLHVSGTNGTRVIIEGGSIRRNVAASEGGGLWNQQGSTIVIRGGTAMSNNLAFGDNADNGGGAIFNNGGSLTVDDASIVSNFALGVNGSGGGIFTSDGRVVVRDTLIDSNAAGRAGGGVEVITGFVRMERVNLNANTAGTDENSTPGNGGGLHVSGGNAFVRFLNGNVQNNTAANEGGGLWNAAGSRMHLKGTVVSANSSLGTAANDGGGGIYNDGGRLAVVEANVSGNDAATSGGGILNAENGTTVVRDSIVNGNVVDKRGGGMFNAGQLTVIGTDVIGNVAGINGGGIFTTASGTTNISGSNVTGNAPNNTV